MSTSHQSKQPGSCPLPLLIFARPFANAEATIRTFWVISCLLSIAASAQSSQTLEAARLHLPQALTLAKQDEARCATAKCADAPRLAMLVGYLELSAGDGEAALKHFSGPAPEGPLQPFFHYYRGEAFFYTRQSAQAATAFREALKTAPKSLIKRARARLGEALWAAHDPEAAAPFLEKAASELDSPELLYARAEVREALNNSSGAYEDWKRLATRFATHPYGEVAWERLHQKADFELSIEQRLLRARIILESDPSSALVEILDTQLKAESDTLKSQLDLVELQALYALGREQEAEAVLARALKGPEEIASAAALLNARRALKQDDHKKAHRAMSSVAHRYSRTAAGEEASFFLGWIDLQAGREAQGLHAFEKFLKTYPRSSRFDEVSWLKSLCLFQMHHYRQATQSLERLLKTHPQTKLLPQALYWMARAEQLGGAAPANVRTRYLHTISQFPSSFYAWLSRVRLEEMKETPPSVFATLPQVLARPLPPGLQVAAALANTGLFKDARDEIRTVLSEVRSVDDALGYGYALLQMGEYGQAYALAIRTLWARGYGEKDVQALALLYPRPYSSEVAREAEKARVDPYLLWAIMRKESGFREDVKSGANARGLMQLIPITAKAVAAATDAPAPSEDDLFSPTLNIELAAWYVGQLSNRFQHPALVAAAYNAGPPQLLKWLKQRGSLPLDLFVELLPFRETRGYVKQVMADYFLYHALYDVKLSPAPSLTLPLSLEHGIGF